MIMKTAILFALIAAFQKSACLGDDPKRLFREYFDWKVKTWPLYYNTLGVDNCPAEVNDYSPEGFAQKNQSCFGFFERAQLLLNTTSPDWDVRTVRHLNVLARETQQCFSGSVFMPEYLPNVDFENGVQLQYSRLFATKNLLKLDTIADHRNVLEVLKRIPVQLAQIKALLMDGIDANITFHNTSLGRDYQWDQLNLTKPYNVQASVFYRPFADLGNSTIDSSNLQKEAKKVIGEQLLPAFADLRDYIFDNYTDNARTSHGLLSLPDGSAMYESLLEFYTTVRGIRAKDIHNLGLKEVQRIKCELMSVVLNELALVNSTFPDFAQSLISKQDFSSSGELLYYFDCMNVAVEPRLASIFGQPVLSQETYKLDILTKPPGWSSHEDKAYYQASTLDGRGPEGLFVDTSNLKRIKKIEVNSIILNEGNPGHHFEQNYRLNRSPLPKFLKHPISSYEMGNPANPLNYYGFVEGWAFYAEFLGYELGMYFEPSKKVGYLTHNLLNAARMVVDTGIHSMDWSREKAENYLAENAVLSSPEINAEIDRIVTFPGKAAAVKIGELKIRQLRKKKEKDPNFDIKAFHENVLNCMGPMDWLEKCVAEEEGYKNGIIYPGKPTTTTTTTSTTTTTKRTTTTLKLPLSTTSNAEGVTSGKFVSIMLALAFACNFLI